MATLDYSGTPDDTLSEYDAKFVKLAGADTIINTPTGTALPSAANVSAYYYNDGQTGLDQSSSITLTSAADSSGGLANAPFVHASGAQTGLSLYIGVISGNIAACSVRQMNPDGSQTFIANVGNSTGAAAAGKTYKITARDDGTGLAVDIDVEIDGTPYIDVIESYAINQAFPGQVLYLAGSVINTLEVTPLVAGDTRTITLSDKVPSSGTDTRLKTKWVTSQTQAQSEYFTGDIDYTVYLGSDPTTAVKEPDEDTGAAMVGGEITISITGSSAASGDDVLVSTLETGGDREILLPTVYD